MLTCFLLYSHGVLTFPYLYIVITNLGSYVSTLSIISAIANLFVQCVHLFVQFVFSPFFTVCILPVSTFSSVSTLCTFTAICTLWSPVSTNYKVCVYQEVKVCRKNNFTTFNELMQLLFYPGQGLVHPVPLLLLHQQAVASGVHQPGQIIIIYKMF